MADTNSLGDGSLLQETSTTEEPAKPTKEKMDIRETETTGEIDTPSSSAHVTSDTSVEIPPLNESKSNGHALGTSILSASELTMSNDTNAERNTPELELASDHDDLEPIGEEGNNNEVTDLKPAEQVSNSEYQSSTGGPSSESVDTARTNGASDEGEKGAKDWIDVLGNGFLLKKVLRAGEGVLTRPPPQSQVRMRVRGILSNGTVIDRQSGLTFTVGDGDVIQALDIVASLMEKGEICQMKTDARYAYGSYGKSPDIPPDSTLMYELELLDINPPLDITTISERDLISYLNKKRGRGNDLFQRKEFPQAVHSYSRAVEIIRNYRQEQQVEEFSPEIADLWIRCLNNLAAAQLKVEMYDEALTSVEEVLKFESQNVKALYRCGKVYLIKGDLDKAVTNLQKASDLSPDEKAIQTELQKALRKRDQERGQERALYRRMMAPNAHLTPSSSSNSKTTPTTSPPNSKSSSWGWKGLLLGAGVVAVFAVGIALISKYRK